MPEPALSGQYPSPIMPRPAFIRHRLSAMACGGFTLIEMLVVMMIMGLLLGLISVIAIPNDRDRLELEAERLAQLLNLAAAESRLTGKPLRWTSDDGSGYRFWRRHQQGWIELQGSDLFRPRTLPEGMRIAGFQTEALPRFDAMRLEFQPHSLPLAYGMEIVLGAQRATISAAPLSEARVQRNREIPDGTLQP